MYTNSGKKSIINQTIAYVNMLKSKNIGKTRT